MQEKIIFVILNFVSKIHLAPVGEKFDIFYDLQQKSGQPFRRPPKKMTPLFAITTLWHIKLWIECVEVLAI
mgnify:CR=1 FL=1